MSALLQIRELLVKRGGRITLQIDSLDVSRGEVLAIVGPNGAGKSTLLLTLARLIRAEGGRIQYNGRPFGAESDTIYRRRLALVLQEPLLFEGSVYDNVAIGLRFRGISKNEIQPRVETWLEQLGISHLRARRASELSGGEAQRVSLARALVLEPELLLLDEPFTALDPPTRARLLNDLSQLLGEQQRTSIFITHDLNEAAQLADAVAILLNGQLRQYGLPGEILRAPADAEIAAFVGSSMINS